MALVLASANIPVECVAVAAGIDRLIDMGRTVMSVTGDASCAVVMQKTIGETIAPPEPENQEESSEEEA